MFIKYDQPCELTALEAKSAAQKIAFAPIEFEAAVCLLRLGVLESIAEAGDDGISAGDLAKQLQLSEYGVQVLLDMGLTSNLVWKKEDNFVIDKVGHFLLEDRMTEVNLNFAKDVCYDAMQHLQASIKNGTPDGLKVFGEWPTIYPAISQLPEPAKQSWFEFNNFYSRSAFAEALPIVFESTPSHILDVGGNLGAWARLCVDYDPDVRVTIVDLPEQTAVAMENNRETNGQDRIETFEIDMLDAGQGLPGGADVIWMSQFLDCFSEKQVASILAKAAHALDAGNSLFILEPLWDRQEYEAAAYSINATSLYFTCLANGNSRMFHSTVIISLALKAGFDLHAQHDGLGAGHTLLHFRRST